MVGYHPTDLSQAPQPFFVNHLQQATQGFSMIATYESEDIHAAYHSFETACSWCEEQVLVQPNFGVHVKLEEIIQAIPICQPKSCIVTLPNATTRYISSALISAWDIHLDGTFTPATKSLLQDREFLVLDYISSRGEALTTMTLHFLRRSDAQTEFEKTKTLIESVGGFVGNFYFEDPLGFVVYGKTLPRSIIISI